MPDFNIQDYFVPGCHAHLVGIGGVSMAPLAEVLHGMGMVITGSDMREAVQSYFEELAAYDPSVLGGSIPDDAFYVIP